MASGEKFAGSGTMRIGGRVYNCTSIDPDPSSSEGEMKVGLNGTAGMKQSNRAPKLAVTVLITVGVMLSTLNSVEDETIEVTCADGKSFIFEGASRSEAFSMGVEDREASGAFEAMSSTERN